MSSGLFCLFCSTYAKFCIYLQTSHFYCKSIFLSVSTLQSIATEMIDTLHVSLCLKIHKQVHKEIIRKKNRLYWYQWTFKDNAPLFMLIFVFL